MPDPTIPDTLIDYVRVTRPTAVEREALAEQIYDILNDKIDCVPMEGHGYLYEVSISSLESAAEALIDAGLTPVVTTRARVAGRALTVEQIETAARELHRRDLGDVNAWMVESEHRRDIWRSKARTVAKAFGLSVAKPAVEADHAG